MLIIFSSVYNPVKVSDLTTYKVDDFKDFDFNFIKEVKTLRLVGGFLDDLLFLKELPNLEDLTLSSCKIREKDIETLESLIHLRRLNLSRVTLEADNDISNIDYSNLSNLEILNLSDISKIAIKDFNSLKNLKDLYLIDIKEINISGTIKIPSLINLFISTEVLKDVKFLNNSFPVIKEITIIVKSLQDFELEDLDNIRIIDSLSNIYLISYDQKFSITIIGNNNE